MTSLTSVSESKRERVSFLWVQDVHFGANGLPFNAVTQSFMYVYNVAKRKGIKAVVFGGDTTDRELPLWTDGAVEYIHFIDWLLKDAYVNGIEILGIEGTPSHDYKQFMLFEEIKASQKLETKLLYVSKLTIINLPMFGNVLIVPDEWRTKAVDTYNEVLVLLKEKGLEKVDWAFMHGCFKYQMPTFLQHRLDLHDEEDYCKIVNKGIFIGHHHNFSEYKKIHCAGSLERWSFGQESEKGAFFVEELMNGETYVEFIRNPCAQVYMDVIVDGLTSNEILSKIKKFDVDLHSPINIRLTTTSGIEVVNEFIDKYKYIYTEVKWKSKDLSKKGIKPVTQLVDDQLVFSKINLDFDTLETLMLNRLAEKYPEKISKLTYLFKDMLTDFRGKHGERS